MNIERENKRNLIRILIFSNIITLSKIFQDVLRDFSATQFHKFSYFYFIINSSVNTNIDLLTWNFLINIFSERFIEESSRFLNILLNLLDIISKIR